MFNMKDLGDMTKLAAEAQKAQKVQQNYQDKHINLLEQILRELKDIKQQLSSKA